jgi:hypothetical protein
MGNSRLYKIAQPALVLLCTEADAGSGPHTAEGLRIRPRPIDWAKWREEHMQTKQPAIPAGLSPLKRRMLEKKQRTGRPAASSNNDAGDASKRVRDDDL